MLGQSSSMPRLFILCQEVHLVHIKCTTYAFGLFAVAEHQPFPPSGHRSVTLIITLFLTWG